METISELIQRLLEIPSGGGESRPISERRRTEREPVRRTRLLEGARNEISATQWEERFSKAFRSSLVAFTISTKTECRYIDANEAFLRLIGYSREEVIGRTAEELKVCVSPDQRCRVIEQLHKGGRVGSFETKFRTRSGDVRVAQVSAELIPFDNTECVLAMSLDITDRKMAEEALASLSGRLIDAQEEERKRISREIHDDYSQRLAMLAIDLEDLAEEIGDSSVEASQRLHQLWNEIGELGADLHALSHRLHSSTLESLGLVAGAKAFCEEFAHQQGMHVDFADENVPLGVPGNVALCLFRIVQEGLRNVKRHSGADSAEVRLEVSGEKLHLSVSDQGGGFDVNQRSPRNGIGIRSMKERVRSLGGQLEITSRPREGTRLDAWLPLH